MSDLISTLVLLASLKPRDPADEHKIEDIAKVSRSALSRALNAMPAGEFVHAVEVMLNAEDAKVSQPHNSTFVTHMLGRCKEVHWIFSPTGYSRFRIKSGDNSLPWSIRSLNIFDE